MARCSVPFAGILGASLLVAGPASAAPDSMLMLGGLGIAGAIGLAGFVTALWALVLQRKSRRELRRLMEMVERTLASHGRPPERTGEDRDDKALPAVAAKGGSARPDSADGMADDADRNRQSAADEPAANVIRLSEEAAKAVRAERNDSRKDRSANEKAEADRVNALGEGRFELALEPMISISRSSAVGFDVHATTGADDSFLYRMASEPRPGARLAFETGLVRKAAAVATQQLGDNSDELPLYVPVSASLLQDSDAVESMRILFKGDETLARSLILTLPVHLMTGANRKHGPALDALRDAGVQFAAEGWLGGADALKILKGYGVCCVKLTANRLLEREKLRPRDLDAESIVTACAASGLPVAAMNVNTDEEAVSLIDLGVDIMSGTRFNGPRRLKASPASGKGMLAGE